MIEIYADIVFFINFGMDMLIFWVVSKIIRKDIKVFRLILGSFISTLLFCLIIFVPSLRKFYNILFLTLTLIIGLYISFTPKGIKEFIKIFIITNITSFSIGGMGMALFYFTNISNVIGNMVGFYVSNFSFKLLIIISSTTYVFIKLFGNWFKKIFFSRKKYYEINIFINNNKSTLTTLLDTGNSLIDPITKVPVIIVEFEHVKNLLPNNIKVMFYENRQDNFENLFFDLDIEFAKRIRMIPFASLGKENGMLIGFRPDLIEIINGEEIHNVNDVIVGIYSLALSKNDSYNGLLNPELIPLNF